MTLDDQNKRWHAADGRGGPITAVNISELHAQKAAKSGAAPLSDDEIDRLVREREQARFTSDYSTADRLRDTLEAASLDTKENKWHASDGRSGPIGPVNISAAHARAARSGAPKMAIEEIERILVQREQARARRDYKTADVLRDTLEKRRLPRRQLEEVARRRRPLRCDRRLDALERRDRPRAGQPASGAAEARLQDGRPAARPARRAGPLGRRQATDESSDRRSSSIDPSPPSSRPSTPTSSASSPATRPPRPTARAAPVCPASSTASTASPASAAIPASSPAAAAIAASLASSAAGGRGAGRSRWLGARLAREQGGARRGRRRRRAVAVRGGRCHDAQGGRKG